MNNNVGVVILAAGLGTRMKSAKAKVLHEICGKPMIHYVVRTAVEVAGRNVVVVVGHQSELVKEALSKQFRVFYANQERQLGTGHAVQCALPYLSTDVEEVIILCGDVPLITAETIQTILLNHTAASRDLTLLAVEVNKPYGYGRVLFSTDGQLIGIVEEKDADEDQKRINIINSGIYIVKKHYLIRFLPKIRANNKQAELYLTDIVGLGYRNGIRIGAFVGANNEEILGVNNPSDLQEAENIMIIRTNEKT